MRKKLVMVFATGIALLSVLSCNTPKSEKGVTRIEALDQSAWDAAEWISAANAPVMTDTVWGAEHERVADGASWFVSTLKNEQKVKAARWMTTGLGVYALYVNGQPIGEEILKPGFTHYEKTKRSFTYDITDALATAADAENTLAVQVTPGWWADKIITPSGHVGMIGKKVAFRGVVELTYADGSKHYYGTNQTDRKAGKAGAEHQPAIFDGEE